MLTRIAIAFLWLLHLLPLSVLARIGCGLGWLLYQFAGRRRFIVRVNLAVCFPDLGEEEREALTRRHFLLLGRSILERGLFWWASRERLQRLIKVRGEEKIHALRTEGRPIMLLAPHFVGLDAGGVAITMRFDIVSIYAEQSDRIFNRYLLRGRHRFGDQLLISRRDSPRASIKAMKSGRPFYYLPDLDFRSPDAIFVPFFGVPAATITGLSRLSRMAGAAVVPCVTRMLPGGAGYEVEIGDPWPDFPTEDVEADTRRMNEWIEAAIRTMPEQYYWVHRRFKSRPDGEIRPYKTELRKKYWK